MKIRYIFTTALLSLALGLGVGIGLKANGVKEAKADSSGTVAIDVGTIDWTTASAKIAFCFQKDGETDFWTNFASESSASEDIYSVSYAGLSFTPTKVNAVRFASGTSEPSWDATRHNNVYNLKYSKNMFVILTDWDVGYDLTNLYVKGDHNTWGTTDELTLNTTTMKYELSSTYIKKNQKIKLYNNAGTGGSARNGWLGYTDNFSTDAKTLVTNDVSDNAVFSNTSAYSFSFDPLTLKVDIADESADGAIEFSNQFTTAMATPCADENAYNKSAVSDIWGTWKSEFENLTADAKTEFRTNNNSKIVQARKLYTHVQSRYSLTSWDGASASSNATINPIPTNSESTTTLVITTVSLVSLLAVGGLFFLKKKKQL